MDSSESAVSAALRRAEVAERRLAEEVAERHRSEERSRRNTAIVAAIARIFREALLCETEEDLGRICLRIVEEVTQSRFGFVAELNRETGLLDDVAMTDPGWEACRMGVAPGETRRLPVAIPVRGLYGRVVLDGKGFYTNDPASHPDRIGTPPGHPPITAFLGVPLVHRGAVVGLIGLGNRGGGYGPDQLEAAEALAPAIVQAFVAKRATDALRVSEQRATAHAEALRDRDRRKDEFLAMLSHELRNPLAPIRTALFLLDRLDARAPQAHRAREIATRQVAHLARLVDDLLDVTRIARGKVELRVGRHDLTAIVRRAGEDHRALMAARALWFELTTPDAPAWVRGDDTRLAQVVGNLLQNAAKFTAAGGHVRLSLAVDGATARIRVADDGVGIEPALLDRVFEPFTQGEQSLARTEGGLGLGLALVKGIAALHGGTAVASSGGRGLGAEFVVELPLAGADPAAQV
ncbi:MAG TPA: GAF domain-containing sensor histidine kinase [Anaeromyxobacter sp.]